MIVGNKRINFLTWILGCTGIVFLRGGLSRVSSARAFSATRAVFRKRLFTSRAGAGSIATFASGNSGNEASDDERVPATGWNHNPPKDPDSAFWQSANGERGAEKQRQQQQADSSDTEAPRTGWLHNTESKSKREAAKKAQNSSIGGGASSNKARERLQQAMQQQERNHRIVSPATFHACGNERQIAVTEHRLSIPLYRPNKQPRIDLAFTIVEEVIDESTQKWFQSLQEMTPQQRAQAYVEKAELKNADDMIVYLQGGPGFGSPTPVTGLGFSQDSSWGAKALGKYKRVVLMDQRGKFIIIVAVIS